MSVKMMVAVEVTVCGHDKLQIGLIMRIPKQNAQVETETKKLRLWTVSPQACPFAALIPVSPRFPAKTPSADKLPKTRKRL